MSIQLDPNPKIARIAKTRNSARIGYEQLWALAMNFGNLEF